MSRALVTDHVKGAAIPKQRRIHTGMHANKDPARIAPAGLRVSVQADQDLATLAGLADHAFELRDPP